MVLSVLSPSTSDGRGNFKELWTFVFPEDPFKVSTLGVHSFSFSFLLSFFISQLEQNSTYFGPELLAFETLLASYLFLL